MSLLWPWLILISSIWLSYGLALEQGNISEKSLFMLCVNNLGPVVVTLFSYSMRSLDVMSPHSWLELEAPPLTCGVPSECFRHEKLGNCLTWSAWENWNVYQFNWCLYSSEIPDCKSPWPHKCTTIICFPYANFDNNTIPILRLTPYNWVFSLFTANLGTPNGAGNVILQQLTCVCLIGWELNDNFFECLLKIFISCATCLYYFPLQSNCHRKPVIASLM